MEGLKLLLRGKIFLELIFGPHQGVEDGDAYWITAGATLIDGLYIMVAEHPNHKVLLPLIPFSHSEAYNR